MRAANRLLLTIAALLILVPAGNGCAPGTRYQVLSFFFDGVPPPEGMGTTAATSASGKAPLRPPKAVISKHAPYAKKQCNGCHTPMTNTLIATVPELCFGCHKMGEKQKRYVHAPSLAGFCRLCHDPHLSRHPYLLLAEPREMCFYCHNPEDVAKNPAHADDQAPCTQCHNPHADNRYFLRVEPAAAPVITVATEAVPSGGPAAPAVPAPAAPAPAALAAAPPPRPPDTSLQQSLATLLKLWQLSDLAAKVRGWTAYNVQAGQLPKYFDSADPFRIPGMTFVTAPATADSLRAWNLPCLVREESAVRGSRFVVLLAIEGDRAVVLGPGGERTEIPVSFWVKQLKGDFAFLVPEEALPAALRPGDQGPAVLALEQELQRTGLFVDTPDAVYDEKTAEAVQSLQRRFGLDRDGIASRETRLRLLRLDGRTVPLLAE